MQITTVHYSARFASPCGRREATRALPLHLIHTHVGRFPRESLLGSCSGAHNGPEGPSARSVIGTVGYSSRIARLFPPATQDMELQEALGRKSLGIASTGPRQEEEPGKGGGSIGEQHAEQEPTSAGAHGARMKPLVHRAVINHLPVIKQVR